MGDSQDKAIETLANAVTSENSIEDSKESLIFQTTNNKNQVEETKDAIPEVTVSEIKDTATESMISENVIDKMTSKATKIAETNPETENLIDETSVVEPVILKDTIEKETGDAKETRYDK